MVATALVGRILIPVVVNIDDFKPFMTAIQPSENMEKSQMNNSLFKIDSGSTLAQW